MLRPILILALVGLAAAWWLFSEPDVSAPDGGAYELPDSAEAIERGRYLVAAGGCISCHEGTEHKGSLSGGLALESDFGTFYAPNITPDEATILMMGIYEDTGSLTFSSTTEEDYYAAAFLLKEGANLNIVSDIITKELNAEQISLLYELVHTAAAHTINGIDFVIGFQ